MKQETSDWQYSSSFSAGKRRSIQKRTKERKIVEVLQSVALWRQFYEGFYDRAGNYVKVSLEESALMLDISKKTLDDYLLQVRLATKYKFSFVEHLNEKMGVLRAFVKKQRGLEEGINQQLNIKQRCHFKEIDLDLRQFLPGEVGELIKWNSQNRVDDKTNININMNNNMEIMNELGDNEISWRIENMFQNQLWI